VEAGATLGRRFWALWTAGTLSALGNGCNYVALPLLAAGLNPQPLAVAGVLFAERLPWLVVAIPAGAHADRVDRGRLMRRMDLVRGCLLAALAVLVATGHITLALVYVLALAVGVCDTFFAGAVQAMLPAMVGPPDLARANGLLAVGATASEQTVGPAVGGLLFTLGRAIPFAADAVSFVASAGFLLGSARAAAPGDGPPAEARRPQFGSESSAPGMWADMKDGLVWYRRSPALCLVTATVAVLALSQAMVSGILVLFVLHRLHIGAVGYGLFMAGTALGNVAGGLVAARVLRRLATSTVVVAVAVMAGVGYLGVSATSSPYLAGVFLGLEAVAVTVGNVATISFRQRVTPEHMQARVANVWRSAIWGVVPLGVLAGGALSVAWGLRYPFYVAGGLQLALAGVVARPLRRLLGPADSSAPV
jgi:MFS family permease